MRQVLTYVRLVLASALMLSQMASQAQALGDNPTPYDPADLAAELDAVRSSSPYFVLDALLPHEYQRALDDRKFIGITGLTFSGSNTLPTNGTTLIYANDVSIMSQSSNVCSYYSPDLCYDVSHFYTPKVPQVSMVGLFALDGGTILQWGVNTGFDAPKLTVSPAIMIGLAKRFYFSDARDRQIILEASTWLGEYVKHRPCLDSFDREFFCGTISPWSDFRYDPRPKSDFIKITYVTLF